MVAQTGTVVTCFLLHFGFYSCKKAVPLSAFSAFSAFNELHVQIFTGSIIDLNVMDPLVKFYIDFT